MSNGAPTLHVESRRVDGFLFVEAVGEIDVASAPVFDRSVVEHLDPLPHGVIVDLERVSFIDSSGLSALLRAHAACLGLGTVLVVRTVSPQVGDVLRLMGLDELFREPREP